MWSCLEKALPEMGCHTPFFDCYCLKQLWVAYTILLKLAKTNQHSDNLITFRRSLPVPGTARDSCIERGQADNLQAKAEVIPFRRRKGDINRQFSRRRRSAGSWPTSVTMSEHALFTGCQICLNVELQGIHTYLHSCSAEIFFSEKFIATGIHLITFHRTNNFSKHFS